MSGTSLLPWRRPRHQRDRPARDHRRPRRHAQRRHRPPLIEKAFAGANRDPVILDIESPGGSPVQSDLIASLIRTHADRAGVRVHAVIREVGASGGYWIACAADEIHANPMSIVGSIGVVGGGFGFPHLLDRLGIERRIYYRRHQQGPSRPVQPREAEDVAFVRDLMDKLHARFKDWVRLRRGPPSQGSRRGPVRRQLHAGRAGPRRRPRRQPGHRRGPGSPTRRRSRPPAPHRPPNARACRSACRGWRSTPRWTRWRSAPGASTCGNPSVIALKSALLAMARARGHERGFRVLSTTGVPAEAQPPFAAQPQTLQPLTMRASSLPPRQRAALFAAFGLGDDIAPT